jgi:patatin-like phospholipase/acyl hydrolase
MSYRDKIAVNGPKKLLALDGGGIRGLIAIEVLAEIERVLAKKLGRGDDFVLADYFDYVAGTSTGAIIATCVSYGMRVDTIRQFYFDNGTALFDQAGLFKRLRHKYDSQKLAIVLKEVLGEETTLGSENLRTLLMAVLRNASTDSPWLLSNNPNAKYNRSGLNGCNLDIPLWQIVRASTAAPTFFPPEEVQVGEQKFVFVDGGVTTYNNPAFILFLMATIEPYRLQWPVGEDKMLLVSIGTGTNANANANLKPEEMNLLYNAASIPSALMFAALNQQDMLCRVFSRCLAGDVMDSEIGDLLDSNGPVDPKLFTYMRYNAELSREGLDALGLTDIEPAHVQKLDSVEFMSELSRVGEAAARRSVRSEHFEGFT